MPKNKVTLQWLKDILAKNELSEVEIDVMNGKVHFMLQGRRLSSKRMTLNEAYDWLWTFIEGVRFEQAKTPVKEESLPYKDIDLRIIVGKEVDLVIGGRGLIMGGVLYEVQGHTDKYSVVRKSDGSHFDFYLNEVVESEKDKFGSFININIGEKQ